MRVRRAAFGAVAACIACTASPRPVIMQSDCMADGHMESGRVVRARVARAESLAPSEGAFVVRVRRAGPDSVPLPAASVALHADTASSGQPPAAWAQTDSVGVAALDPVAAGEYLLRVRAIGYGAHAMRVRARAGFTDTVMVTAVPGRC